MLLLTIFIWCTCRLKVHYTVVDGTGSTSVVFWDRQANDLLHRSAAELKHSLINVSVQFDSNIIC